MTEIEGSTANGAGMVGANACLHRGVELLRALDRTDFFRLFKSCALAHGFTEFGLIEAGTEVVDFSYSSSVVLHSWASGSFDEIEGCFDSREDVLIGHLLQSSVARAFAPGAYTPAVSPLMMLGRRGHAALVPLFTPTSRRFGLVLLGKPTMPEQNDLANLAYETASIFQLYFEKVLAPEPGHGLTAAEIRIVVLSAEGASISEIAMVLGQSVRTVTLRTETILRKLGAANRAQMVAKALRAGLIH
jgi:LuxR family transcriptional regulator, quorum-sensing system regulator SdiA